MSQTIRIHASSQSFLFFLAAIFFSIIVRCDRILPTVFQCDFFFRDACSLSFLYIYGCEGKNSAHNLAMSWLKVHVRNVYNVPPSTLQISLKCKFEIHKQPRSISGPIKYSESNARCKCVLFFTFTNVLFHYVLLQVNQQLRLIFCTKIMQVFSNSDNKCFASKKNDIKFKNYLYYIINITFFKSNLQFVLLKSVTKQFGPRLTQALSLINQRGTTKQTRKAVKARNHSGWGLIDLID